MSDYEPSITSITFRSCCPHLGLISDRTLMLTGATSAHRCYVQLQGFAPDINHQDKYCLDDNHVNCPFYAPQTSAPRMVELVQAPALSSAIVPFNPQGTLPLTPQQIPLPLTGQHKFRFPSWSWKMAALTVVLGGLVLLLTLAPDWLDFRQLFNRFQPAGETARLAPASVVVDNSNDTATAADAAANAPIVVDPTFVITSTPMSADLILKPSATPPATADGAAESALQAMQRLAVPTAVPEGQVFYLNPSTAGWWVSNDPDRAYLGDSFLYAGVLNGDTRLAAMRFDLSSVPRGAAILETELRLTGIRQEELTAQSSGAWLVQLIAENSLKSLGGADFLTMYSVPTAITLPELLPSDLAVDQVNRWTLDPNASAWLAQQILDGAKSVTVRILPSSQGTNALFAWDSGLGPQTKGNAPALIISINQPPATPPALPTRPVVVATLTPVPENVMTVVALDLTATSVAMITGTYTAVPIDVVTPTPFPENLATVQAVAIEQGLPAVVLETPTPANDAQATADAEYATAVALTTGTFTPVPTGFVTPILVYPSPSPENLATEAARIAQTNSEAEQGIETPTPLPHNAVIAKYVYATPLPMNQGTAVAVSVIATAFAEVNGTPTPLPWGVVIITAVPTWVAPPVLVPTATPLPPLQVASELTATPTATAAVPVILPDRAPDIYSKKILFKTNRGGPEETYALDPATGELYRVNEAWVYPFLQDRLGLSPDGGYQALVQPDANRTLQIQIHSLEYGTFRQLTGNNDAVTYDPTWSPRGDLIAYVSTVTGNDEIFTSTIDGSAQRQLTANNQLWDKHPSFSPDGSQIVFFSNRDTGRRQLWLMNADGSNQHNLSNNEYEDWDPIWVP